MSNRLLCVFAWLCLLGTHRLEAHKQRLTGRYPETDTDDTLEQKLTKFKDEVLAEIKYEVALIVADLKAEIASIREDNRALNPRVVGLQKNVESEIASMREDNRALNAQVVGLQKNVESVIEENASLQRDPPVNWQHHEETLIAFSVASHWTHTTINTNVPYPIIYVDIGNTWHTGLDAFEAPVAGVYLFTASMRSDYNYGVARLNMILTTQTSQTIVASMYGSHGSGSPSGDANSVLLELQPFDLVSVQLTEGAAASGPDNVYSTFSGFLLSELQGEDASMTIPR